MTKRKICFFVPPKVQILDLAGPVQVFYEAIEYGAGYEILYVSNKENLLSSCGLPFGRIGSYKKARLKEDDFLFLPGAEMNYFYSDAFKKDEKLFEWLNKARKIGVNICSVCTGAFMLGEAGMLDGIKCTTHWKRIAELKKAYPKAIAQENILFTKDRQIYTSAGITSGIDLSLFIIEEHYGALFVHKIARELVVYHRRSGSHSQNAIYLDYRNHLHVAVHVAQDWIIENLDKKFTIDTLANITNVSARNLTRLFRKATGISINQYTRKLRLEKAQTLAHNSQLGAESIASQVGYSNARQLRRIKKSSL
ncbi:MAG: GlxA family transcriptional regulator [Ginsengibacter sp.]